MSPDVGHSRKRLRLVPHPRETQKCLSEDHSMSDSTRQSRTNMVVGRPHLVPDHEEAEVPHHIHLVPDIAPVGRLLARVTLALRLYNSLDTIISNTSREEARHVHNRHLYPRARWLLWVLGAMVQTSLGWRNNRTSIWRRRLSPSQIGHVRARRHLSHEARTHHHHGRRWDRRHGSSLVWVGRRQGGHCRLLR